MNQTQSIDDSTSTWKLSLEGKTSLLTDRQNPYTGSLSPMQLNHRALKHLFALVSVPSLSAPKKILTEEPRNRAILELLAQMQRN